MLSTRQTAIIAWLDTRLNNLATLDEIATMLTISQADAQVEIGPLVDVGVALYDPNSQQVRLSKPEGEFVPEADPTIDPAIQQSLAALFADQGVSLGTFLAGLNGAGIGGSRIRVGAYVARQLALAIAARRSDDRLRQPLLDAAHVLGALYAAGT